MENGTTRNAAADAGAHAGHDHATQGGQVTDADLHVWLLGHLHLRHKPDMVRVALRIFFRDEADALHERLLRGDAARAPDWRGEPAQLARMLRSQGFQVALRRGSPD